MSSPHQKKRNAGLLYEFLVRTISKALIEGNKRKSSVTLKILKRYFKPGTELHKEFRLINSLMKTTVSNQTVAGSILAEAKAAAKSHDVGALDKEKSLLIHAINHAIQDDDFYDQQVNEYRMYATTQTLLNDWRKHTAPDLQRLAKYEDELVQWLVNPKPTPADFVLQEDSPGTSRLLMKVMTKKLNEKYSGVLTETQRALMKAYAFASANNDSETVKKKLAEIKQDLLAEIDRYSNTNRDPSLTGKLEEAKTLLLAEKLDVVDDDTVTRFMLYVKLGSELTSEETD